MPEDRGNRSVIATAPDGAETPVGDSVKPDHVDTTQSLESTKQNRETAESSHEPAKQNREAPKRNREPWIIRTYAGFGDAQQANRRFLNNLKQGQRGLSIAFDLPTQNGYDSDAPVAAGEVGKAGVSISHWGDMQQLLEGIPLDKINTSMTLNSTPR